MFARQKDAARTRIHRPHRGVTHISRVAFLLEPSYTQGDKWDDGITISSYMY